MSQIIQSATSHLKQRNIRSYLLGRKKSTSFQTFLNIVLSKYGFLLIYFGQLKGLSLA